MSNLSDLIREIRSIWQDLQVRLEGIEESLSQINSSENPQLRSQSRDLSEKTLNLTKVLMEAERELEASGAVSSQNNVKWEILVEEINQSLLALDQILEGDSHSESITAKDKIKKMIFFNEEYREQLDLIQDLTTQSIES